MHAIPAVAGIYQIANTINGKMYVGSTNCLARRWPEHRKKLRAQINTCTRLQAAWNKYGEQSFVFSVLEIVGAPQELIAREQFWIDTLRPGYNIAPAAGSQSGIKHSSETRALLSRINKITPEQRSRMVAGLRSMSAEAKAVQRARQSAAHKGNTYNLGRTNSSESNVKRSEALKGRVFSEEHRAKLRANHWRTRIAA